MLTDLEKKIIAAIETDIPVVKRPYLNLAEKIGVSEEKFLEKLKSLCQKGVIRRLGATIRHQKSGFVANAMVAWKVKEERIDEVGRKMASFNEISHCYRRNPSAQWPYNLYTMIHAADKKQCIEISCKISEKTSVKDYTLLFSKKELKKTSMRYFSRDSEIQDTKYQT